MWAGEWAVNYHTKVNNHAMIKISYEILTNLLPPCEYSENQYLLEWLKKNISCTEQPSTKQ